MRPSRLIVGVCAGTLLSLLASSIVSAEPGFTPVKLMPNIIGAPSTAELAYASVSCSTTQACTAVGPGFLLNSSSFTPLATQTAITERGGRWGPRVPLPLPSDAVASPSTSAVVSSVSCAPAQGCIAVGNYPVSGGGPAPLIETDIGGHWSARTITLPGGATGNAELSSIWCGASSCIAFGAFQGSGHPVPMVDVEIAGTWAPATAMAAPPVDFQPISIGCAGVGTCVAAGFGGNSIANTVVWSERDGVWGAPLELSNPSKWQFIGISVACPTDSTCLLGGGFVRFANSGNGAMLPAVRTSVHGVWSTPHLLPTPRLTPRLTQGLVTSIACPTSTTCVAVGGFLSDPTNSRARPGAYTWMDGRWSSAGMIRGVPLGGTMAYQSYFSAVACADATSCIAIGPVRQGEAKQSESGSFFAAIAPARSTTVPSRPTSMAVHRTSHGAIVTWAPPISDGGAPVLGYTVSIEPGAFTCTPHGSSCRVGGLRPNGRYLVTVTATNRVGHSSPTVPRWLLPTS
jgi:Fibronectin type III domain